jgi:hypothetical protein
MPDHFDTPVTQEVMPNVQVYGLTNALQHIRADIADATNIFTWTFLLEETFFENLFGKFLERGNLYSIVDHRMRGAVTRLQERFPRFAARSWSYNRTMHEKTFLFSPAGVTWMGSHNLTQGSFTMASNRSARIDSTQLFDALYTAWFMDWDRARPVTIPRNI